MISIFSVNDTKIRPTYRKALKKNSKLRTGLNALLKPNVRLAATDDFQIYSYTVIFSTILLIVIGNCFRYELDERTILIYSNLMKVATRTQRALDLSLQKMRLTSFRYVLLLFFVL